MRKIPNHASNIHRKITKQTTGTVLFVLNISQRDSTKDFDLTKKNVARENKQKEPSLLFVCCYSYKTLTML